MTPYQEAKFEEAVKEVLHFLEDYDYPSNTTVIITRDSAEMMEGYIKYNYSTNEIS
jgi:alkaline phosphatase